MQWAIGWGSASSAVWRESCVRTASATQPSALLTSPVCCSSTQIQWGKMENTERSMETASLQSEDMQIVQAILSAGISSIRDILSPAALVPGPVVSGEIRLQVEFKTVDVCNN